MNIYVGNLPYDVTEADLQAAFEAVASARIITDQAGGQSKGFVEMPSASEAQAAITGLHGTALLGRTLHVNEARPRAGGSRPEGRSGGEGADPGDGNAGRPHARVRSRSEERYRASRIN
jgi:RNA recognition motif-containing protein